MYEAFTVTLLKFQEAMFHFCIASGGIWEKKKEQYEQVEGVQALLCWNLGKDYVISVLLENQSRPFVVKFEFNMLYLTGQQLGVEFMVNSNLQERLESIQYTTRLPLQLRLQTVCLSIAQPQGEE